MVAYTILGVDPKNANDENVREAYLKKIREYPPEKKPAEFQIIRDAYEKIDSYQKRVDYYLFGLDNDIPPSKFADVITDKGESRLKSDQWESLCQIYIKRRSKKG